MKVLAFGEILWDVIEGAEHLGGAPFNFAAHSVQCGNQAYIISRLGTDYLGMRAYNQCKSYGVKHLLIQWDEEFPTGTVDVKLNNGQPDYTIHTNVAYDYIDSAPVMSLLAEIGNVDVFYFGSLAQRGEKSAGSVYEILSKVKPKYVFYDVNLRKEGYSGKVIRKSLGACNVFKLNNEELPLISQVIFGGSLGMEDFLKSLVSHFPHIMTTVVTAAEKGCYVFQKGRELVHVPGVAVKVVDAVGAGDAFSAAFMHMLCAQGDAVAAAGVANRIGAFVAASAGAIPAYDSSIKDLLKSKASITATA